MTNLKMLPGQAPGPYCIPSRPLAPREIGFVPEVLEPVLRFAARTVGVVISFIIVLALSMLLWALVGALAGPMGLLVGLLFGAILAIVGAFTPDNR